ncbi:MAG TPA: Scr1 family TA system antitoxin-like transcriptional regulator [Streptosporangiaceae bacterium]
MSIMPQFEFADPADPTVVYLEHLTGSVLLEDEEEVRCCQAVFDHLRAEALGPGPSADLIARTAAGQT